MKKIFVLPFISSFPVLDWLDYARHMSARTDIFSRLRYTRSDFLSFFTFFLFFFLSTSSSFAQEKNKLTVDEKSGKPMLLGICDRTAFADTSFAWWFNSEIDNYTVDSVTLKDVPDKLKDVKITIVMGTWCSDSRREVPRFFKILDCISFDQTNLTLICVDRTKTATGCGVEKLDIKLVPTFIFYKGDVEVGRIIETPKVSLEKDLVEMMK